MAFMPSKFTIRPQPRSSIPGRQARESHTLESRSTEITRRQSESLISRKRPSGRSAALFTSTSTAPKLAIASRAMRAHSSATPTSAMATKASTPSARASVATFSQASRLREPLMTTLKPMRARSSAMARPILRPAPVIKAVLRCVVMSVSFMRSFDGFYRGVA